MDHSLSFYSVGFSAIEGILHVHTSQSISHWPHVTLCSWNVAHVSWELNWLYSHLLLMCPLSGASAVLSCSSVCPLSWWCFCETDSSVSDSLARPWPYYLLSSLYLLSPLTLYSHDRNRNHHSFILGHYSLLFLLNTLFKNLHKAGW